MPKTSARSTDSKALKPVRISRTSSLIALDPEIFVHIDEGLGTQGLVMVRAPAMSGKTTIVREWHRRAIDQKHLAASIELRAATPLSVLIEKLSLALGFEIHEHDLKKIFEEAADQKITLIIDGLDRVQDSIFILTEALEVVRSGIPLRLLMTVEQVHPMDPLDLLDFRIIDYSGLQPALIEQLLKSSGVLLASPSHEIALKLFELTKGNPSLVRLSISTAIQDQRPLSLASLSASHSETVSRFIRTLMTRAEATSRKMFEELALIQYSQELRHQIISSMDSALTSLLEQASLIRKNLDESWELSPLLTDTVLAQLTSDDITACRERILQKARSLTHVFARAEEIHQLNSLHKFSESAEVVNQNFEALLANCTSTACIELTDPVWKLITPPAYRLRHMSFSAQGAISRSNSECQFRIANAKDPREAIAFKIFEFRVYLLHGHYPENVLDFEANLNQLSESDPLYWEINFCLARYFKLKDPKRAEAIYREGREKVEKYPQTLHLRRAFNTGLAGFYETTGHLSKAIEAFELMIEKSKSIKDIAGETWGRQGKLSLQYDSGQILNAMADMPKVLSKAEATGHIDLISLLHETQAAYAFDRGLSAQSLDIALRAMQMSESGLLQDYWMANQVVTLASASASRNQWQHMEIVFQKYKTSCEIAKVQPSISSELVLECLKAAYNFSKDELKDYFEKFERRRSEMCEYYCLRTLVSSFEIMWQRGILISVNWLEEKFLKDLDADTLVWKARSFQIAEKVLAQKNYTLIPQIKVLRNFFEKNGLSLWLFRCDLLVAISTTEPNLEKLLSSYSSIDGCEDAGILDLLKHPDTWAEKRVLTKSEISVEIIDRLLEGSVRSKSESTNKSISKPEYILNIEARELTGPKGKVPLADRATAFHLLRAFAEHPGELLDKERLTKLVWNEAYNPLVHDTRVYTSIRRLREIVEIETIEGKYRLNLGSNLILKV